MKIHIWISSHIHAVQRHYWFLKCLNSLIDQEVEADEIYVSYSVEKYVSDIVDTNYSQIFQTIKFVQRDTRLYQFEHIKKLNEQIDNEYDDEYKSSLYIMFCDDDDMYAKNRVSTLKPYLSKDVSALHDYFIDIDDMGNNIDDMGNIIDVMPNEQMLSLINQDQDQDQKSIITFKSEITFGKRIRDFGNYVVKFNIIGDFFKADSPNEIELNNYSLTDLRFTIFVTNLGCKTIPIQLYYKRRILHISIQAMKSWLKDKNYDFMPDIEKDGLDKKWF